MRWFELGRGRVPCLIPVSCWGKLEFLCLSENLKTCIFPERTSPALQGDINFPQRQLRFLSLKSWITFLSFPPVIYRRREQAFSCRSLTVYLFGWALTMRWLGCSHWAFGTSCRFWGPGVVGEERGCRFQPKANGLMSKWKEYFH